MKTIIISLSFLLFACSDIPKNINVVNGFNLSKYLGTWYEIARLDHSFEEGLHHITAQYSLRDDGGIKVINKGRHHKSGEWKIAEGKAYFVDKEHIGRLKVSFFGPFYGGYNIIALDKENYSYSIVTGPNNSYLWILSRKPQMPKEILDKLVNTAQQMGFDTENLIYVNHNHPHTIKF